MSAQSAQSAQSAGFVRVGAAVPPVRVTDFGFNREQTLALWREAHQEGAGAVFVPELGLASYTAGDRHLDSHLWEQSRQALTWLLEQGQ
ncbi:MAG TPA: NAD(+) synthase, partial [Chloroflexota bacterium]|nr:NAD(+) synthase [Chloroflexota bacterium]